MAFRFSISKLNWRLILLHFAAMWFFMNSFRWFGNLHDTSILNIYINQSGDKWKEAMHKLHAYQIFNIVAYPVIAASIGMFVGFIISIIIVIRKKLFWLNSLLAFLLIYLLSWLDLLDFPIIKIIIGFPGRYINNAYLLVIVNGCISLIIGLVLFFSKWSNKIIFRN